MSADRSWNHAKKKDGQENGDAQQPGQESPSPDHEESQGNQAPKAPVIWATVTPEFLEVMLEAQSEILEQMKVIAASVKILSEWCESNWTAVKIRGPE